MAVLDAKTKMFSATVLLVVSFQGALGTFPPVSNSPPIPGQSVRILDTSPQQFYVLRDANQEPPQPNIRDAPDKQNEQRYYIQESSNDPARNSSAVEGFDRFYPNGEPAIGPVATPLPDVSYVAQPSIASKLNPGVLTNARSNIWILTKGRSNEYVSEQWIPMPTGRVVKVRHTANQSDPVIISPREIPGQSQFTSSLSGNTVLNTVAKVPNVNSQKVPTNPIINGIPTQILKIPPQNSKQIVQQFSKGSVIIPAQPQTIQLPHLIAPKNTFSVPPPPPIKGVAKSVIDVPVPGRSSGTVSISGKNGLSQQIRHIWVPTSSRTGRFISVPITSSDSRKYAINKGVQANPAAIGVSDAWILKQDGLRPRFEQPKLFASPLVSRGGMTAIRESSPFPLNRPMEASFLFNTYSSKNPAIVDKSINSPLDVWPIRNDFINSKSLDKVVGVTAQDNPSPALKSVNILTNEYLSPPTQLPVLPVKSTNLNVSPKVLAPVAPNLKDKFDPAVPQTSQFLSKNPSFLSTAAFRLLTTQNTQPFARLLRVNQNKQPLTRIIRINRNPSGSYYLLNTEVQPSTLAYPSFYIRQSETGLVHLVQTKQVPISFQSKQPVLPTVQMQQISIPTQPKVPTRPAWLVAYSLPAFSTKSTSPLPFPLVQMIKHAKPNLVADKGLEIPQESPIKVTPLVQNSESTPPETSSSGDSASEEKSNDVKEETSKKEESGESEKLGEEVEKEGEELAIEVEGTEPESEEANETAEN